jgi:hypothetical protein
MISAFLSRQSANMLVLLSCCNTDRSYDARPVEFKDAVRHEFADEKFKSGLKMKLHATALIVILFDHSRHTKVTKEHHGD